MVDSVQNQEGPALTYGASRVVERVFGAPTGRARRPLPFGEYGTRPTPKSPHKIGRASCRERVFALV